MNKKKVVINVTADDIAQGKTISCTDCPIALALRRHLRRSLYVQVYDSEISYLDSPISYTGIAIIRDRDGIITLASLTKEAKEFIQLFDKNKAVSPFKFEIEIMKECLK